MNVVGHIQMVKVLQHTRKPSNAFMGYDIVEDYFGAMQGKLLPVLEVAVNKSGYLVLCKGEKSGNFIWDVDPKDVVGEMKPAATRADFFDMARKLLDIVREGKKQ